MGILIPGRVGEALKRDGERKARVNKEAAELYALVGHLPSDRASRRRAYAQLGYTAQQRRTMEAAVRAYRKIAASRVSEKAAP